MAESKAVKQKEEVLRKFTYKKKLYKVGDKFSGTKEEIENLRTQKYLK